MNNGMLKPNDREGDARYVFLFQRQVPHYRVPIFNRLATRLQSTLVVCAGHLRDTSNLLESADAMEFSRCELENYWWRGNKALWQTWSRPFREFGAPKAVICEASLRILSLPWVLLNAKVIGAPVVLWGHVGSRKRSIYRHTIKDWANRRLIRSGNAFLSYTHQEAETARNVRNDDNVFVARNTLDTEALDEIYSRYDRRGKEEIKRSLDLSCDQYIAYIGRLREDKRVVELVDVLEGLQNRGWDIGLLVIGDGPEMERIATRRGQLGSNNIHLLGAMADWEDSGRYLFAADVVVMPGYVGLAVVHAFAFGCPVVTRSVRGGPPHHSPEVDYIRHRRNGYIVESADIEALVNGTETVLSECERYSVEARSSAVDDLTPSGMVDGFEEAIAEYNA